MYSPILKLILFLPVGLPTAQAGVVLTLQGLGPTTVAVGDTVDIDVFLTQTTPIIPGADLTTDGIQSFSIPLALIGDSAFEVIVADADAAFGPFDFSDPNASPMPLIAASTSTNVVATMTDPTTVRLGTFRLQATNPGTVSVSPFDTPGNALNIRFGTVSPPTNFDSQVFAVPPTLSLTAVPEPSSFLLLALLGLAGAYRAYSRARLSTDT